MGFKITGNGGTDAEVDGTSYRALRVAPRPIDAGALGHYRLDVVSGTVAAALAAGAVVFTARWGDATRLAVITSLRLSVLPLTPFTGATLTDHTSLNAFVARGYTGSYTNQTALTLTGNSFKMRTSYGTTLFTDIRVANTAAITGGTVTLDPHPFCSTLRKGNRVNPAAATEEVITSDFAGIADIDFKVGDGEAPLILAQNEGIVVTNRTVWPAAGTAIIRAAMAWSEVTVY